MHLFQENPDKGNKEDVTDIYLRGQYKEEIAEDAARCQTQQIEHSCSRRKLAEQIIEHCQQHNDEQPDAQQEDRENKRHFKRRKRGIKVEVFPRFGHKDLYRLVQCSAECHQQAEQQRVHAVNVIEINHLQLFLAEQAKHPGPHKQSENDNEIRSMRITEQVNELGDAICRHKSLHHLPLTNPALYFLRMG